MIKLPLHKLKERFVNASVHFDQSNCTGRHDLYPDTLVIPFWERNLAFSRLDNKFRFQGPLVKNPRRSEICTIQIRFNRYGRSLVTHILWGQSEKD